MCAQPPVSLSVSAAAAPEEPAVAVARTTSTAEPGPHVAIAGARGHGADPPGVSTPACGGGSPGRTARLMSTAVRPVVPGTVERADSPCCNALEQDSEVVVSGTTTTRGALRRRSSPRRAPPSRGVTPEPLLDSRARDHRRRGRRCVAHPLAGAGSSAATPPRGRLSWLPLATRSCRLLLLPSRRRTRGPRELDEATLRFSRTAPCTQRRRGRRNGLRHREVHPAGDHHPCGATPAALFRRGGRGPGRKPPGPLAPRPTGRSRDRRRRSAAVRSRRRRWCA
ncbi:hypothetical protein CLV37_1114 [Kineococcus rhizosphaerae]|uniref:Uncharacterized protein n=1 Tax=Kineococcus rhizosphaerae TaxID=559628 RepID=A0A2T0QZC9_9ACTN|nr:hypothetical protein CLV37_1114 [Kineococcus rhizosphaerae]